MASLFKRKGKKWWIVQWFDHRGKRHTKTLDNIRDKKTAQAIADKIATENAKEVHGLVDPVERKLLREGSTPIEDQIKEWKEKELQTGDKTKQHADEMSTIALRVMKQAKVESLADVTRTDLVHAIDKMPRQRGKGELGFRQKNKALTACKMFLYWCVGNDKRRNNPLARVKGWQEDKDQRKQAVAFSEDEERAIIEAARRGPRRNGMSGGERAMLYELAAGTGFRKRTLLELTPSHLHLAGPEPFIHILATNVKNEKQFDHPVTLPLAAKVIEFTKGMEPNRRIFRPRHPKRVNVAFKRDVADAGLAYQVDEIHFRMFRSWRNTYLTNVGRSGDLKVAQDLAGHSTPALTAKYMRPTMRDYRKALKGLPGEQGDKGQQGGQRAG